MVSRRATHCGSWYTESSDLLERQLDSWLRSSAAASSESSENAHSIRAIIGPHAGYAYSGETAAYAYKFLLKMEGIKRIFILGPSHHFYLTKCALSKCDVYETPLGHLALDKDCIAELKSIGEFDDMPVNIDEDEHSIEMHLPYVVKCLKASRSDAKIVPVLVGSLSEEKQQRYGEIFAKHLKSNDTVFIVSSDFCHWGRRFGYYHLPSGVQSRNIYEKIEYLDREGMRIIESGSLTSFNDYLRETGNTICGRFPISVLMAATEYLSKTEGLKHQICFNHYDQSNKAHHDHDSSVSYASAFVTRQD
jgi:AmmeMemoRadiSam system protein B